MTVPGAWCAVSAAVIVQYGFASVPAPVFEQFALVLSTKYSAARVGAAAHNATASPAPHTPRGNVFDADRIQRPRPAAHSLHRTGLERNTAAAPVPCVDRCRDHGGREMSTTSTTRGSRASRSAGGVR